MRDVSLDDFARRRPRIGGGVFGTQEHGDVGSERAEHLRAFGFERRMLVHITREAHQIEQTIAVRVILGFVLSRRRNDVGGALAAAAAVAL